MAYTEVKVIVGTAGKFNAAMATAITQGFQPVSDVTVEGSQVYSVIVAKGSEYSITEAKVLNASSRKSLFTQMESASAQGFTVDSASVSLESGQQFAFVYKGSKGGGGASSVAWGEVTGKPATFATNAASITDAGATGRTILQAANGPAARTALGASAIGSSIMIAADAPAVRTLISAGTSSLVVGTAAGTAMAGDKTLATIGGVVPSAGLPAAGATIGGVKLAASPASTPTQQSAQIATTATLEEVIAAYNKLQADYVGSRTVYSALVSNLRTAGTVASS